MLSIAKCIIAVLLVAQTVSAFIPVTSGPTLNQEQGKIAGIGGIDGPKPMSSGGVGAFSIKGKNKKATPTPKKTPAKKNNFWAAKKVTNTKPKAAAKVQPSNKNPFSSFLSSLPTPK